MISETAEYIYSAKCIYNAHTSDVRVLKPTSIPDGGILTGSRDTTTKVWAPKGKLFKECNTFKGATTFIASLCVLPPSTQYPKGLFLAGCNDCSIYGFTPDSSDPVLRLLGHSGTVCTLSYGIGGFIISGSWDKTARVWNGQQCVLTLQGHLEAVWATDVFPTRNLILTGSADHTIRLWRQGVCEKVFTGHNDCVRGLAIISDKKFLSCSNDSTIRLWLIDGECAHVFKSHTDFVYSISILSVTDDVLEFATCGEDQNVKIWRNDVCIQTIVLAPKSLWDVACLTNGDLAVGSSDGKVYVFKKILKDEFENIAEVCKSVSTSEYKTEGDEPNESIFTGEIFVTYENKSSSMYVCYYDHVTGTKIKKEELNFHFIDITFYKKSKEEAAANTTLPAKAKDYVFNVDVENTIYKLSFDKGENPWDVATKFVGKHNLSVEHIGQIVDYIFQNTVISFTNEFYPAKNFLYYQNVNVEGLKAKLLQFSEQVPKDKYVSPSEVDDLMLLTQLQRISVDHQVSLDKVLTWSDEFLFPVLDLLRIGVQCSDRCKITTKEFMNHMLHIFMTTNKSVNRVLIEKIFCNMFSDKDCDGMLSAYQEKIFAAVKEKLSTREQSIQKAASALFFNFAVASYKRSTMLQLSTDRYCLTVIDILNYLEDPEAIYRMLVAIGTVCTRNGLAVTHFRSVNLKEFILKFKGCTSKIDKVVDLLFSDL